MEYQKEIERVAKKIRGQELQIINDFVKCRLAYESLQGKDLIELMPKMTLHIQHTRDNNQMGLKAWITFDRETSINPADDANLIKRAIYDN
jgi:hypothetical protein